MSAKRFLVLLIAALVVISFAFWLSTQRYLPRDRAFGTPVLAGLAPAVDDVRSIRIVGPGNRTLVTIDRPDGRWRVAERGYPADGRRVRALLRSLGELQVLEPKTRDPRRHAALGVEDVAAPDAGGLRVELRGPGGPTALIVGHASDPTSGYVRVQGAAQALLATPRIDLSRTPDDWLARTIVDVAPVRVQSVTISRDGSRPWRADKASRDAAHFAFGGSSGQASLSAPDELDTLANALAALEFDDVRRAAEFAPPAGPESRATFRTFDGLLLEFVGRIDGDHRWLQVAASADAAFAARFPPGAGDEAPGPEQVRAEAERIDSTTRGWWYRVGADRYDRVFRPLEPPPRPRGTP
jgi:hypothetical protein